MAYQQFDLSGTLDEEKSSAALALADGEIAQVRFTACNAEQVWFAVTRNGVTTREIVTDQASDVCSIMGPASIVLSARVGNVAHRVTGILEGV